ncbi:protein of unknown function [Pseudomonas marincola]|uniref:Uncharacterized protein n=1 Tax=Pseudomonas marincola TaxID=437900 RepID=A0A8S2BJE7_9PSED|nr:protein of unknown function [Pseudomonas marincola]
MHGIFLVTEVGNVSQFNGRRSLFY